MDLKECYNAFGGNYDEVIGRFRREQMVEKFMLKFLDDQSYQLFEASMSQKNYEEALRAVHTLKGIAQNLSFTKLFETSFIITKALKENDVDVAVQMVPQLADDYKLIIDAVSEYRNS